MREFIRALWLSYLVRRQPPTDPMRLERWKGKIFKLWYTDEFGMIDYEFSFVAEGRIMPSGQWPDPPERLQTINCRCNPEIGGDDCA